MFRNQSINVVTYRLGRKFPPDRNYKNPKTVCKLAQTFFGWNVGYNAQWSKNIIRGWQNPFQIETFYESKEVSHQSWMQNSIITHLPLNNIDYLVQFFCKKSNPKLKTVKNQCKMGLVCLINNASMRCNFTRFQ